MIERVPQAVFPDLEEAELFPPDEAPIFDEGDALIDFDEAELFDEADARLDFDEAEVFLGRRLTRTRL